MHALTRATDLELSVRSRRIACVLDPALLLSAPQALLMARQLAAVVDIWLCPALWRLLDASEFFQRSPVRLARWLGLPDELPAAQVSQALELCCKWRASTDLSALGMYWVGLHQTESFLPEQGPRDIPIRFESLLTQWLDPDGQPNLPPQDGGHQPSLESALECAALSVALQSAPILTLAATPGSGLAPKLTQTLTAQCLSCHAWPQWLDQARVAEQQHWWQLLIKAGAAATVATGLRLSIVHVVAPHAQFLVQTQDPGAVGWTHDPMGDDWPLEANHAPPPDDLSGWWHQAQALWFDV